MAEKTAARQRANGSVVMHSNGAVQLVDPTAANCCCECPACVSETPSLMCNSGGTATPTTWRVTIPAQVLATGCFDCNDIYEDGRDASWRISGAYTGGEYCLVQIGENQWAFDALFDECVVEVFTGHGCPGVPDYATDRLGITLSFDAATNIVGIAAGPYDSAATFQPFATNILLFEAVKVLTFAPEEKFCCNGADFLSEDPTGRTDCGDIGGNGNRALFTTQTTGNATPCCTP